MVLFARVLNLSPVAQSIEFLNDDGDIDCATIISKGEIRIDEESITTSQENLIKRGLKIISAISTPSTVPTEVESTIIDKVEERIIPNGNKKKAQQAIIENSEEKGE